jgi:hypothetical protein
MNEFDMKAAINVAREAHIALAKGERMAEIRARLAAASGDPLTCREHAESDIAWLLNRVDDLEQDLMTERSQRPAYRDILEGVAGKGGAG